MRLLAERLMVSAIVLTCAGVQPGIARAEMPATLRQQLDEVQHLLDRGAVDEATTLLQHLDQEYPENPSAAMTLGKINTAKQNYLQSVGWYEKAIRKWARLNPAPEELALVAQLHYQLVDDYNELGQQHYFSPELCLRMLYHLERAWPSITQDHPTRDAMRTYVEFARKTVGHYDIAKRGIRMMEGSAETLRKTEQASELLLEPDGIDEATKLQARETVVAHIRAFDAAQAPEYAVAPTDRSLEDLFHALDAAYQRITSIHYRKFQIGATGTEELAEETWYQSPRTLKTHQTIGGQDAWFLISGERLYGLDEAHRMITGEEAVTGEPGWLMTLRKPQAQYFQQGQYTFVVQKLSAPPAILQALYQDPPPNLYLVTGTAKNPDGVGEPPVIKVEYFVDLDRGLLVGLREYWHGVLGSGRDEELSVTDVVTQWTTYPDHLVLPVAGRRDQLVDEFTANGPGHRVDRTTWRVEVASVNKAFEASMFDLSSYAPEHPAASTGTPPTTP